jgi:hypothetical protein
MAAGNTYVALATQTLGSAAASVTFSSISGAYTDLILVFNGTESANQYVAFQVNSDTGSNYSFTRLYGDGTSAYSSRGSSTTFGRLGIGDPTNRTLTITHFMNYSNATTYKTVLSRSNADFVGAVVNLWRSTAAITSITALTTTADTFSVGSTFTLYGIAAA